MIYEIEPHLVQDLLDRLDPAPQTLCAVEGCVHHLHDAAESGLAHAA